MKSKPESLLALHIRAERLTPPLREFRFHPIRRFRADFAWPEYRLLVEVEGGIYLGRRGAHSSPMGIQRDIEKNNAAVLEGWRLLRFSSKDVKTGVAIRQIKEALNGKEV